MTVSRTADGSMPRARRRCAVLGAIVVAAVLAGCSTAAEPNPPPSPGQVAATAGAVCGRQAPGPSAAPAGAVVVDPASDMDLYRKSQSSPPGTVFWLAPGRHTLGSDQYGQAVPKDGNIYVGAPGAVVDGRGMNNFAFTGTAKDVTIRNLTIRGFDAPRTRGSSITTPGTAGSSRTTRSRTTGAPV